MKRGLYRIGSALSRRCRFTRSGIREFHAFCWRPVGGAFFGKFFHATALFMAFTPSPASLGLAPCGIISGDETTPNSGAFEAVSPVQFVAIQQFWKRTSATNGLRRISGCSRIPIARGGCDHLGFARGMDSSDCPGIRLRVCRWVPVHGWDNLSPGANEPILGIYLGFCSRGAAWRITAEFQGKVERSISIILPIREPEGLQSGETSPPMPGACCLKYGVTRDYVLGLQVALANGAPRRLWGRGPQEQDGFDPTAFCRGARECLGGDGKRPLKFFPKPRTALVWGGVCGHGGCRSGDPEIFAGGFPECPRTWDEFTAQATVTVCDSLGVRCPSMIPRNWMGMESRTGINALTTISAVRSRF